MSKQLEYYHVPDVVILNTDFTVRCLYTFLKNHPNISVSLQDLVSGIVSHINDREDRTDSVMDWADDLMEELTSLSKQEKKDLLIAVKTTAHFIFTEMDRVNLFTEQGRNWYMYYDLLGYNLAVKLQDTDSAMNIMEENFHFE